MSVTRSAGDDELVIKQSRVDPKFLEVKLTPVKVPKPTGKPVAKKALRKVYRLEVRIPPGTSAVTRKDRTPAIVTLLLNHKLIKSFRFAVEFDTY